MVRLGLAAGLAIVAASGAASGQESMEAARPAITHALEDSAAGWNEGNLDRFMGVYKRSPDISYVSSGEVVRGFDAVRARYAARFAGAGDKGRLSISLLSLAPAGSGHIYAIGRYHLRRAGQAEASGITTLLFQHVGAGWLIVADHS